MIKVQKAQVTFGTKNACSETVVLGDKGNVAQKIGWKDADPISKSEVNCVGFCDRDDHSWLALHCGLVALGKWSN